MEINENIPPAVAPTPEPNMILTETAQFYLQKAGKWASFLGIMGFIGTGFIAIAALFMGTIFTTMATMNPMMGAAAGMGSLVTVFYLLLAVVSFFFALYLYQFGSRVKDAIAYSNTEQLTSALGKLKSFFKLWGIITIVYIVFVVLALAFSIATGLGAASMMNR
ncbi:DUF5362 family protein [Mucilaginibacter sp. 44-25]|uniref:DUF5362 family protein n=1 Tax=Mucilaginibacter sp. 44-25 TaxID=1895794 RepID=UPI0009696B50|nr:DUF5362 family protein [Mucilaginibacter sp. 44-25]OJW14869.1 MAG: hypothetical protein BGO48_11860 [Mucilaginibacter sp. 44-25]